MADLNGFNAREVQPTTSFDPIPNGKYVAAITESEMKATKNGNGSYLQLTFTIVEGEYKNRVVWTRLNLNNPNATAVKIARSELSAICHAIGIMQPRDSAELHNVPVVISVKSRRNDESGELVNVIKGYEAQAQAAPADFPQAVSSTPPWKR